MSMILKGEFAPQELIPHANCVYRAIEQLHPFCQTPTNEEERTWLGVQLAVCEFEAAHVEYPYQCHNRAKLSSCTTELGTKATWWTTFSGSYRHISTVCAEYQSTHEAELALRLHRNISHWNTEYYNELHQMVSSLGSALSDAELLNQVNAELQKELYGTLQDAKSLNEQLSKLQTAHLSMKQQLEYYHNLEMKAEARRLKAAELAIRDAQSISDEAMRAMAYMSEQRTIARDLAVLQDSTLRFLSESEKQAEDLYTAAEYGVGVLAQQAAFQIDQLGVLHRDLMSSQDSKLQASFSNLESATGDLRNAARQAVSATNLILYMGSFVWRSSLGQIVLTLCLLWWLYKTVSWCKPLVQQGHTSSYHLQSRPVETMPWLRADPDSTMLLFA